MTPSLEQQIEKLAEPITYTEINGMRYVTLEYALARNRVIAELREENKRVKTVNAMLTAPETTKYVLRQYAELNDEGKQKINALMDALMAIRKNK